MNRYFADIYDSDGLAYIFDSADAGAECCGPFADLSQAKVETNMLNENDSLPNGIRPHQLQHALDRNGAVDS